MSYNPDFIEFPDKVFERFLLENFDFDEDGRISADDAARVESMQIDGEIAPHITSLQGIEHFTNLLKLMVQHTNISTLDVSRNKNLEDLDCVGNRLFRLNLGRLCKLKRLYCDGNRLERLDVSGLPSLKLLHCGHNRLTELDLANRRQLIVLWCGNNLLTELNVSDSPLLFVRCENNLLTELDLSANKHLINVQFNGNPLERLSLPARYDSDIEEIICDTRQLETVKQHYTDLWSKVELDEVPTPIPRQGKLFSGNDTEIKIDFIPAMQQPDKDQPTLINLIKTMETSNKEEQINTNPNDTLTKPRLNKHAIYGFLLSCVITPALAIPLMTTIFQIRLAKYNIKKGKEPKSQWGSAILTIFLVFAIMVIVVAFALMEL